MSVTFVPSDAKNDAYSTPMTPPPTSKKEKAVSKVQDGLNIAGTTSAAFEEWAKKSGIEKFEPMEIHEFPDTGRGVRATTEIVPSARIVKVRTH